MNSSVGFVRLELVIDFLYLVKMNNFQFDLSLNWSPYANKAISYAF